MFNEKLMQYKLSWALKPVARKVMQEFVLEIYRVDSQAHNIQFSETYHGKIR